MKLRPAFVLLLMIVTTSAAVAQTLDGQIRGAVVDATGLPLPGQRVELRQPRRDQGRLVAITDANGAFTFTRLQAGQYRLELVIEGRAVTRSAVIELSETMMQVSHVTIAPPPVKVRKDRSELAKLLILVGVSAAVGVAALVIAVVVAGGV